MSNSGKNRQHPTNDESVPDFQEVDAEDAVGEEGDSLDAGESDAQDVVPVNEPDAAGDDSEVEVDVDVDGDDDDDNFEDDDVENDGDDDVSLDALSEAYARAINHSGDEPAADLESDVETVDPEPLATVTQGETTPDVNSDGQDEIENEKDNEACPTSPQTILESMLFVGSTDAKSMTTRIAASLMRDVSPKEVTKLIKQLNEIYEAEGAAYRIEKRDSGYRMVLAKEFEALRQHLYGEIREARLSQAAIEVLAIVAYNQPVTRDDVDELRLKSSGSLLNQLVRRQLLSVEKKKDNPRVKCYSTTARFLEMFSMESIDDLPQSQMADPYELLDQ